MLQKKHDYSLLLILGLVNVCDKLLSD